MKVKMQVVMSGTRNGESWPLPGTDIEVPDEEGANMCANGLAVPVRSDDKTEKAVKTEATVEKRGPGRPRKPKADN
jgi:hypothetical protein